MIGATQTIELTVPEHPVNVFRNIISGQKHIKCFPVTNILLVIVMYCFIYMYIYIYTHT